jgi:hypothetical protein
MDPACFATDRLRFAKQEAGNVQDMTADIRNDELLEFG